MKHFTKQNSYLCSLHGKSGIQINITIYTSKEKKINNFLVKKNLSATKLSPPSNAKNTDFYRNFIAIFSLNEIYLALQNLNLLEEMKYGAEL